MVSLKCLLVSIPALVAGLKLEAVNSQFFKGSFKSMQPYFTKCTTQKKFEALTVWGTRSIFLKSEARWWSDPDELFQCLQDFFIAVRDEGNGKCIQNFVETAVASMHRAKNYASISVWQSEKNPGFWNELWTTFVNEYNQNISDKDKHLPFEFKALNWQIANFLSEPPIDKLESEQDFDYRTSIHIPKFLQMMVETAWPEINSGTDEYRRTIPTKVWVWYASSTGKFDSDIYKAYLTLSKPMAAVEDYQRYQVLFTIYVKV